MRVLFVVADANLRGGTEILAFHLLHEMNKTGIECRLLTVTPYRGEDPMVESFSVDEYDKWANIQADPFNKLMGSGRSDNYLRHLIASKAEELGAEWIINHTYDICAAIPTDSKWKTAQVFNWSIRGYEDSLQSIILKKRFTSRLLSLICFNSLKARWHKALPAFTRLVMLTDAAHAEIKVVCPKIKEESLETIPDPLMQHEDSTLLSSLMNKNLVFVGRLSHEKGVMRLLRIWEQIKKQLPDYTLSIYGTGEVRKEMEVYIADHNLRGVKFLGFCNDLEKIYSNADLLLMTSDSEGFGMVLIEAMYYGVPCITFDCPVAPKEIVGDAGIAIPCFHEQLYADTVIELLNDKERMQMMQQRTVCRARNYYINKVLDLWIVMTKY